MFDKMKYVQQMMRLMQACGGDIDNPSKTDLIVASIVLFPLQNKKAKKELPFCNKYVLTDAAIISMLYAIYNTATLDVNDQETIPKFIAKIYLGICEMYKIDQESLLSIAESRIDYFEPIIKEQNNEKLISETTTLFLHDIANNQFVPFNDNSPLPIMGIEKQVQIELHTIGYFKGLLPIIEKY